jgi:predicted transcriptional regulator
MPDRENVAKIVTAYTKRNQLPADQLPALILPGTRGAG